MRRKLSILDRVALVFLAIGVVLFAAAVFVHFFPVR
jgi:hypothetical protein